jgi:hypothetical protein
LTRRRFKPPLAAYAGLAPTTRGPGLLDPPRTETPEGDDAGERLLRQEDSDRRIEGGVGQFGPKFDAGFLLTGTSLTTAAIALPGARAGTAKASGSASSPNVPKTAFWKIEPGLPFSDRRLPGGCRDSQETHGLGRRPMQRNALRCTGSRRGACSAMGVRQQRIGGV